MFDYIINKDVFFGRIFSRTGNNQRSAGFVDKDGIDFVDNGVVEIALNAFAKRKLHIVTKIVKTELIVCRISDVGIVGFLALYVVFFVNDIVNG